MPPADVDWSILQKIDVQEVCDMIMGSNYTGTHSIDDPEYEVVGLTWRQKFALKRIIWKAWLKRVLGLDRD